jgi:hypothetical protein
MTVEASVDHPGRRELSVVGFDQRHRVDARHRDGAAAHSASTLPDRREADPNFLRVVIAEGKRLDALNTSSADARRNCSSGPHAQHRQFD